MIVRWEILATAVAILFGTHNVLVKRAAGRVPDAYGAFALETAAAGVILLAIGGMVLVGKAPPLPRDGRAIALVVVAGMLVGAGSVLYFSVFRLGAPLSVAVPWVLSGWVAVVAVLGVVLESEPLEWRHGAGLISAMLTIWLLR